MINQSMVVRKSLTAGEVNINAPFCILSRGRAGRYICRQVTLGGLNELKVGRISGRYVKMNQSGVEDAS
jgi:hypothetical protein